jgi:hypothetical protein
MKDGRLFHRQAGPRKHLRSRGHGLASRCGMQRRTLPQERYNAQWVREKQVGVVLPSFRKLADVLPEMLQPETLVRYRANVVAQNNRAVFEIPELLARILDEGREMANRPSAATFLRRPTQKAWRCSKYLGQTAGPACSALCAVYFGYGTSGASPGKAASRFCLMSASFCSLFSTPGFGSLTHTRFFDPCTSKGSHWSFFNFCRMESLA